MSPDSYDYIRLAKGLLFKHIYGTAIHPEIFRVPGYPVIISFFILIFKNGFLISLLIFQAFIDSLTCLLVYKLSNLIFKYDKISILAGIFQVISILSIVYCSKILSETIFTFMIIFTLFILQRLINKLKCNRENIRYISVIILSLFSAVLCYLRAIFLPLSIFLIIVIFIYNKKIILSLIAIIVLFCCLGGWYIRNYEIVNYFGFSSVPSINIYRYNACALEAEKNKIAYDTQQKIIDDKLSNYSSQAQKARFSKEKGFQIIKENPILYLYLHFKGDIKVLFPSIGELYKIFGYEVGSRGTLSVVNTKGLFAGIKHYFSDNFFLLLYALPLIIFILLKYLVFLFAFIYLIFKKSNTERLIHIIYLIIILYFILVPGPVATPRFRVPVEPLINIYAAFGFVMIFSNLFKRKEKL
ncbi:MAG TPA: hypothetical protein QF753_14600 [Victivallales bacterium]|nr:hypothetical protein [Victivallales bacterium]